ncbi:polysaccharide biosynthesis tyrosine autokinase [Pantoea coffeiphila]|uniref:Tyrosine-protein kinase n=1 Tax=Pantoea coffeiphila TaxID=1465635 RepID=A0A2S9IG77_9GAMM|nr:polysaccharide biosynthesis tyrosine autokinase [Pantoea coffeiphila]PRD16787.1 tyrosine-protein kinase [Pantoea coffeiphila]
MSSLISNKPSNPDSDKIELGRLIGELIDHRKLIISVTAAFAVLAVFYALLATPIYQADALIQVEQKQGNAILGSLSQILPDAQPVSAPEIALLQSRMILGKTVDDLNLQAQIKQKYFPLIGRGFSRMMGDTPGKISLSRLYLPNSSDDKTQSVILTVKDNNHYQITGDDFELDGQKGVLLQGNGISLMVNDIKADVGTKFTISYLTKLKAINNLQENFNVADQGKDTGMLNLSLVGDDQELIAKTLDSISQNYLLQNIERQAAQNAKSLEFLERQLPNVRSDLDVAEDKLNSYRRQKDSIDLPLEAKSILDQIVNVDNQLNGLTFREAEISQLYTKEHPTYKALVEKRSTLEQEKNKLSKQVSAMPETQQEVLRLSRDVESGRAVYMQLLNRQQELSIAKSSAIGNVRIIDSAVTEPKSVKPKKVLVVLIGIIFGICFSVGIVLVRAFLRRGIDSPEQLEEIGVNVYSSVPASEWLTKRAQERIKFRKKKEVYDFLAIENPADLAIEAIRSLRTSLHFAMMESRNNILMISGASPNCGKTFISSNLSAIISMTGKKVLFIDADMRKGYAHRIFGHSLNGGLSDILSGKTPIENAYKRVDSAGFDFISRGQVPPNPAELLMHPRFKELLADAEKKYDLIIVDTPPILAVTDAAIIGNYVGTTLLVARFEENTVKEMEVSVRRFEQSGIPVKGCILNGVIKKASSYYTYGNSYYGYSYKDDKSE